MCPLVVAICETCFVLTYFKGLYLKKFCNVSLTSTESVVHRQTVLCYERERVQLLQDNRIRKPTCHIIYLLYVSIKKPTPCYV